MGNKISYWKQTKGLSDKIKLLIMTWGGLGLAPKAPGTVGTLGGVVIFAFLVWMNWYNHILILAIIAGLTLICGFLGPWMEKFFQASDPSCVVIDEVAGYLVSVLVWDFHHPLYMGIAAFAAFRLFDIWKPFPIHLLEKAPHGWGVMLDDLGAGILAALMVNGFLSLL